MSTPVIKKKFQDTSSDDELTTPMNSKKALHKKFGNSDSEADISVVAHKTDNMNNESELSDESDESDDDAPEEESIDIAKVASQNREKHLKQKLLQDSKILKQRRRERDHKLKEQKKDSKRLLPDGLLEEAQKEAEQALLNRDIQDMQQPRISGRMIGRPTHKRLDDKTMFKKGPVTVKVLKGNKNKLAPSKEAIIDTKRDRFLRRRSVPRR